jgi:eukaryotic-like serine/threonine-protein kinase
MSSSPTGSEYKYWAFISYSHQDNLDTRGDGSENHVRWANWLLEQLETFRIPDTYRDRLTPSGEQMPERFLPVFRDEDELPTSHDLGGQIRDALKRSRFLIVIASPRSARSRYVNEEVRYFRQLGRGDHILTLIVDGEPNVRLTPKHGWTADDDCFCPALVHPLRDGGEVDETRRLPEEPIAADVRMKNAERIHELRADEVKEPDRRDLLEHMKLKLVAGLMGVGLDELVQRDKARQIEAGRKEARKLRRWLTVVSVLAILVLVAGVLAFVQRNRAETARNRAVLARNSADEVIDYLQHSLRDQLKETGRLSLLEEIDERVARYQREHPPGEGEPAIDRERGVLMVQQGDVLLAKGKVQEALRLYLDSQAIMERLAQLRPNDHQAQDDLSISQEKVGDAWLEGNAPDAALESFHKCVGIRERLVKAQPQVALWKYQLSAGYIKIGDVHFSLGQFQEALKFFRQGLAHAQSLAESDPNNVEWQAGLSISDEKIGDVLLAEQQPDVALESFQQSFAIRERLLKKDPENAKLQESLTVACYKMGQVLLAKNRPAEALEYFRQNFVLSERRAKQDPSNAVAQRFLYGSYFALGEALGQSGQIDAAMDSLHKGLELAEKAAQADPHDLMRYRDLALVLGKIGSLAQSNQRWAEAAKAFSRLVVVARPWLERQDAGVFGLQGFAFGVGSCWEVLRDAPPGTVQLDRGQLLKDLRLTRDRLKKLQQQGALQSPLDQYLPDIERYASDSPEVAPPTAPKKP